MNRFPADFNSPLTGFGGDPSKDQAAHKSEISRTPIVLVHGNGANATHPKWGWQTMVRFLNELGYSDTEIWAMDYLGEDNDKAIIAGAHRDHIEGFRNFVDNVKDYLGVTRLDFIGHSLGCGMLNAYIRGLQSDGTWNQEDNRIDVFGTFVALAGGTYGLGLFSQEEFKTGSDFEIQSHKFDGIDDDTPFGSVDVTKQISPEQSWKKTSSFDNDSSSYVAVIAVNDFVDMQYRDTSRREGADLNARYDLGYSLDGHEKVIKSRTVFNDFKVFLGKRPPQPAVTINIDKPGGNYPAPLPVTVTVDPMDRPVDYVARRLRKEYQAGYIVESADEKLTGSLSNGESLTLTDIGAWEATFSASGAEGVGASYGVGVDLPVVTMETDNTPPFKGSLNVMATTTRGKLYHSLDEQGWTEGAILHITRTCTVYFVALDALGIASAVVERAYSKKPDWDDRVTATLCEHFIAGRLDLQQFLDLGSQIGFTATVTLYLINGEWGYNPDLEEAADEPPVITVTPDGGTYTEAVKVIISAQDQVDPNPRIFYSLDGLRPTESSSSFISCGSIDLTTSGRKTLRAIAKDSSGHWSDEVTKIYEMTIVSPQPDVNCDKPNGRYAEAFRATISVSDDEEVPVTVYCTQDGTDPSDPGNPSRRSFVGSIELPISGNGNHAILVYCRDSTGRETRKSFAFSIDDHRYPETDISPSRGGVYIGSVDVTLSTSEACQWTKYTTDGSDPSEGNGITYTGPISIDKTTRLAFRSKDENGNLEPVRTAHFTISQAREAVFESNRRVDGYVKAKPDGTYAVVGMFSDLAIGSGWDGKDSRAILHFDTGSIPDDAVVTRAYLQVTRDSESGDFWADDRVIEVDVQRGYFGTSQAIQGDDWQPRADAVGVAQINRFASETTRSSDFSEAGLKAINMTGVTQMRLRLSKPHTVRDNFLFILGGADAKLFLEYEPVAAPS